MSLATDNLIKAAQKYSQQRFDKLEAKVDTLIALLTPEQLAEPVKVMPRPPKKGS